jgi:hypothetical protein
LNDSGSLVQESQKTILFEKRVYERARESKQREEEASKKI